jgi:hypothetical protein
MDTSLTFVTLTPHLSPVVTFAMVVAAYLTVTVATFEARRNMLVWADR